MRAEFENIALSERSSFACRHFTCRKFGAPYHFHPEYELTLILKSRGNRFVGNHIAPFLEGDLVFLGSNLPHFWCNYSSTNSAESIVIQFKIDCFGKDFFIRPEMKPIRLFLQKSSRGLKFAGKTRDELALRMKEIFQLEGIQRVISLLSILDFAAKSKEVSFLSSPHFKSNPNQVHTSQVGKVISWVNRNYQKEVFLKEAAAQVHMTQESFCRFFKKHSGKTFFNFLNEVRVAESCRRLIETDDSITNICFDSGFLNVSNFNRRFNQTKGLSPREFRRKYQIQSIP